MAVVWACVYLFLAKPLRNIRAQVKSPDFTDKGLKLKNEAGAEFIDLAEGSMRFSRGIDYLERAIRDYFKR